MFLLLSLLITATSVAAQELPGTSWALNPQYKFQEKKDAFHFHGANGFSAAYVGGDLELHIKGTKIEDPAVAKRMRTVEFTNLSRLYAARGNPYEGQITDVIECNPAYKPRTFSFKTVDEERKVLLAGANERHLFGACVKEQVAYWVSYFNFYDAESKFVVESRLFHKTKNPDAKAIAELSKKLEKITQALLVPKGK